MFDCSSWRNCLDKIKKDYWLLGRTVAWRVQNIGSNINSQLKNKANDFGWFSLALGELTDVTDTAHYPAFKRDWRIIFYSLFVKTINKYIFEEIERTLTQYNLKGTLLRCVPNDSGKIKQKKRLSYTNLQSLWTCKAF